MGAFSEEVKCNFKDVRVAASVILGKDGATVRLYVDGKVEDEVNFGMWIPSKFALVRANLKIDDAVHVVEVYAVGFFNKRLVIQIDDVELARSKG